MALILDGTSATGAWSMYRDLLTSFVGGTRYTTATGVNQVTEQTGSARHLRQTNTTFQPVVTTAGPNSRTCADFDGSNDSFDLASGSLSNFITASSGYVVVSFIADAITSSASSIYDNNPVFSDGAGYIGLFMKSPNILGAFNWDGNADAALFTPITTATPYVAEWRHEGGNLYVRVNGGTETSVASGNTSSVSGGLQIAGQTIKGNIKFFEIATWSTVPALATRNAIVANFMAQHVAAPAGRAKVWNGSAWVIKPVKVWSGSAWVTKPAKVWNGSAWV
jgi:hypothetical protein